MRLPWTKANKATQARLAEIAKIRRPAVRVVGVSGDELVTDKAEFSFRSR